MDLRIVTEHRRKDGKRWFHPCCRRRHERLGYLVQPIPSGCLFLLAGMAVTFGAIATTAPAAFIAGAAVAGAGFGLAFLGSFRVITALAEPDDRAGLVAAFYIVGYLAFSVPALAAGAATTAFGLHSTALVYSGSLDVLAAAAVGLLPLRRLGRIPRTYPQLRDLLAGRDDKFVIGVRVTAQPPS